MTRLPKHRVKQEPPTRRRKRSMMLFLVVMLCSVLLSPLVVGASAQWQSEGQGVDVPDPEPSLASAIFSDDFEAFGDSSRWSREHPFPVQSHVVANGSFAARIVNTGGSPIFGRVSLNAGYDRLFVRFRFSIMQLGSPTVTLLNLRSSGTTSVVAIRVDTSGHLSYVTGATGVTSSSAVAVEFGTWHELQVLVDRTSERRNVRIWLDNAYLTTLRENVWLGDRTIRMLDLSENSFGQQSDIAFDDVIVDNEFIPADRLADPVAGTLVIHTFPAWKNIPFELDGQTFYSGDDGTVKIPVARWSPDLRGRISVRDTQRDDGSLAVFTGWKHWYSVHSRNVYAAFRVSKPVTFSFVDRFGEPVDPSLIDRLTIKSRSGDLLTFQGTQLNSAVLIPVLGTTFGPNGIETRITTYVVDEVIIGGANAVHRSQQRSSFDTSSHWTIPLLFYSVTFRSRDAFFGMPLGDAVVVVSPDGATQEFPLDENGIATIPRLSRGEYSVSVVGGGYSPPRPIYVSRDQAIDMKVISPLDIGSLLFAVGSVVVALLVIGRPFLVTTPFRLVVLGVEKSCSLIGRRARRLRWEWRS